MLTTKSNHKDKNLLTKEEDEETVFAIAVFRSSLSLQGTSYASPLDSQSTVDSFSSTEKEGSISASSS